MTTIKEFIERGAYPKDDKGRALVPYENDGCRDTFVVITADKGPDGHPIAGFFKRSTEFDAFTADCPRLLPPPPRKVKVTTWGLFWPEGTEYAGICYGVNTLEKDARQRSLIAAREPGRSIQLVVVPLTGEYEEPWS